MSFTAEPPPARAFPRIDRRQLFRLGALGAAAGMASAASAQVFARGFSHGVASGEPGPSQVLLWTRYVGSGFPASLRYEIARDADFVRVLSGGDVEASPERDWCAKAVATGLEPGKWYYYRFVAPDGTMSETGRTRTLPQGPLEKWRMAVFSCSNLGFGWFNAYAHAAEVGEFDMALHLGDYFYEYPRGSYPNAEQALGGRTIWPQGEIVALADYRLRHASYRMDADLRRLTQLYPMVLTWDDHESANDSWQGGAQNHQPDSEGDWDVRKAAAIRAYREWLPVSDHYWTSYDIGDLATIFRLETRLTARDEQLQLGSLLADGGDPHKALTEFRDTAWIDPARTMLGAEQEEWLSEGFRTSAGAGRKWQVLANQVVMGNLAFPDLLEGGAAPADLAENVRNRLTAAAAAGKAGLPGNMDAWDGYPSARSRLLESALNADANLLVLAGDTHNGWACELGHDGAAAGVEFAGHSVTSPGMENSLSFMDNDRLTRELVAFNPQLKWANLNRRGYMALELTPSAASCEWRFMDTVREKSTRLSGTHRMASVAGSNRFTA
jgi:alkaline phosphatase D